MTQEEIDALIESGAAEKLAEMAEQQAEEVQPAEVQKAEFQEFSEKPAEPAELSPKLQLLLDIQLPVSIELGRTKMYIRDILQLTRGSVVEFEKLASEPVDLLVNGKKVAEGEIVVIDKHFGIRITSLVDAAERVKALR